MSSRLSHRAALTAGLLATAAVLTATLPAQALTGGSPVAQGKYGFTAKIDVGGAAGCSGVLVAPEWLLTASTCFAEPGEGHNIPGGAPRKPSTAIVNRADAGTQDGVLANIVHLIPRTDRNVVLAKLDKSVGVALPKIGVGAPRNGENLVLAGYGRTRTEWSPLKLQSGAFTVSTEPTATSFGVVGAGEETNRDNTTCKGDSGGPAFREVGGQVELVAIHGASWQFGCFDSAETRKGTVETRVDDLGPWIDSQLPFSSTACTKPTPVFAVRTNGDLHLYEHTGNLNGDFAWVNGGGEKIGQGWLGARTVAGPDGVVYAAVENGQLRRLRWDNAAKKWDTFDGGQYLVIDHGWERYSSAAYRNRITVDTLGHLYTIEPDGKLHWRDYDLATRTWQHRVLTGDWGQYDLIVGAGAGVLYARKPNGDLFRHVYHAGTDTFTQTAKPSGVGWQMFRTLFSGGGDTLYGPAVTSVGPELVWYRYLPYSDKWVESGRDIGKQVGTGWNTEFNLTAAPDACRLLR
ncbi:hypothetical protein JOF53_006381 [Crossiella equi]|uniref:Peptidase S1 domain-containing protein n=1 Tax=Crossiella equi TaxID=130796 RepID=A0ABS5ALS7_9PSEU|nr:tachylectin-related carbohydrate-binding protein [Crossiella equi]MBP2477509.1 hypothetical protein [Crossiella equi]